MAEFGSLTTCSLGLITATGGLFCLAAAKTLYSIILHVVVVNINIEKVEICIKFQKVRLNAWCSLFLNEPKSFKTITKCTVESILFVRVNVCW